MPPEFTLADFLPYRLAYLSERVSQRLSLEYSPDPGLTVAEWRVLVNLRGLGTASVRDIQLVTNLEKSRVSRAVGRLEDAGLVRKQGSTRDARLVEIALTDAGDATLASILPRATALEAALLDGLTPDQIAAFDTVVAHLHNVLDADPKARARFDVDAGASPLSQGDAGG